MKVLLVLLTLGIFESAEIDDWVAQTPKDTHSKLYYSAKEKKSKWVGVTDSNYRWDGDRLSWERQITDEAGRKQTVKTYKKPIEIIADIKPASTVYGVGGNIEQAVTQAFGGALTGFVWLDKVASGGEVLLPFTADHIFKATGDRLDPVITELGTDPAMSDYYVIEGNKTRVFVTGFSGMGGAAGAPPNLIAHYKMNENTAGDNAELVTNGIFAAWTGDNPDGWTVSGESGADPEISEVGTGEGHGGVGTGMCNFYTSDGTLIYISRSFTCVIGRKYRVSLNIDTATLGQLNAYDPFRSSWAVKTYTTSGIKTFTFVATFTDPVMRLGIVNTAAGDMTVDYISVKLLAIEDSSGNDHDGVAQQDSDAISVPGKINTALEFNGTTDYIIIPDHADFTPALTPFSISAWVNADTFTGFEVVSKGSSGIDGEWRLFFTSKKIYFDCYDTVNATRIRTRYSVSLIGYENQWVHLVATYDGGISELNLRIYLNGTRIDNDPSTVGIFVSITSFLQPVWIGRYDAAYANGTIDNVMFFAAELTPDEVNILYNNSAGTEIPAELDQMIRPRRANLSPLPQRRRYEY